MSAWTPNGFFDQRPLTGFLVGLLNPLPSCCPDSAPRNGTKGNAVERDGTSIVNDVAALKAKSASRAGLSASQPADSIAGTLLPIADDGFLEP